MTQERSDQVYCRAVANAACEGFIAEASPARLSRAFGVSAPPLPGEIVEPGRQSVMFRSGRNGQVEAAVMTWGLSPTPAADASPAGYVCTVHAEDDPLGWQLIPSQRCVIPATGYLLRSDTPPGDPRYVVSMKNASLFAFAGVWSSWYDRAGTKREGFAILTTVANILLAPFHAAMPVILHHSESAYWLMHGIQGIERFFLPYPSDLMQVRRLHRSDPDADSPAVRR